MANIDISTLISRGDTQSLLLQLLLEVYQLQRDLLAVRQSLGVAQADELSPLKKVEEMEGEGPLF